MVKDIGLEQLYCPDIPQEILAEYVEGVIDYCSGTELHQV